MARTKLTAGRINAFARRPDQQQSFLWDSEAPWLAVRATQGAKVFVFQSRHQGATLRIKIGECAAWDIDQARSEARRLQTFLDQGIDPRQAKADQMTAARAAQEARAVSERERAAGAAQQTVTFANAWEQYQEARAGRWSERHQRSHADMARRGPIQSLHPLPLASLTATQLTNWQDREALARPASAALSFRLLRAFLRWCSEQPEYQNIVNPATLLTKRQQFSLWPHHPVSGWAGTGSKLASMKSISASQVSKHR